MDLAALVAVDGGDGHLAEPEPGAGVIGYDSKISVWDGENEATVTAMAVYVPADPDEPILLATRDISFHSTRQPSGIHLA